MEDSTFEKLLTEIIESKRIERAAIRFEKPTPDQLLEFRGPDEEEEGGPDEFEKREQE